MIHWVLIYVIVGHTSGMSGYGDNFATAAPGFQTEFACRKALEAIEAKEWIFSEGYVSGSCFSTDIEK